jgi:GNAT superfamily N-acetyltransferase
MVEVIRTGHIEPHAEFAMSARALLNDAYPDGAPDELDSYYARHGIPAATILLRDGRRVIGHLAIHERRIRIGNEALQVGLIGEIAVAADHRGRGLARGLVRQAHDDLRARAIPFSILFAFEPRVYASSGYKPMQNETRFRDTDGAWKTFVYRGGMYAELSDRAWPNQLVDLCGPAV